MIRCARKKPFELFAFDVIAIADPDRVNRFDKGAARMDVILLLRLRKLKRVPRRQGEAVPGLQESANPSAHVGRGWFERQPRGNRDDVVIEIDRRHRDCCYSSSADRAVLQLSEKCVAKDGPRVPVEVEIPDRERLIHRRVRS